MRKSHYFKLVALASILVISIAFTGIKLVQAQAEIQGKPPGKGKPPKVLCNNNGICEAGESDSCADCQNTSVLNTEGKQIVTVGDERRVYQIKYKDGIYQNTWVSNLVDDDLVGVSIGDIDNDGEKEIIVTTKKKYRGKPRWQILVYKNDSWGEPYYTSPYLGISTMFKHALQIADADNDVGNGNELIIGPGYHVEMYRWTGNEFTKLWESAEFNGGIWSVDVGDADNDGENEIVLSAFLTNAPIILEYLGNNSWDDEQRVDPVDINCMDISRVRDSDNLMDEGGNYNNEIIAGGCNKKLMIWKYDSNDNYYESVFVSDPLFDFTQGVDAGDFDNDGKNEVIVGTAGPDELIYIFKFIDGEYSMLGSWSGGGCINLSVGNLDNDPEDEIVLGYEFEGGIKIFDYFEGQLNLTFSFPCGEYLEIK